MPTFSRICPAAAACLTMVACLHAQTSINITVATGNDDGFEDSGGDLKLSDDKIELAKHLWAACRFQNVTVPQHALITNAYIRFKSAADESSTIDVDIYAEDVDNAGAFSGSGYFSSRTTTSKSVNWITGNWMENSTRDTPDLRAVVQEIVDRSGWTSGNSLTLLIESNDLNQQQLAWSRNQSAGDAPVLFIDYDDSVVRPELLFPTAGSSPNAGEQEEIAQLEAWGYRVVTLEDSSSQAAFDSALATADVVYLGEGVSSNDIGYKLRTTTVGVVVAERASYDEMGFTTTQGQFHSDHSVTVVDNTHPITSGYALSDVQIIASSTSLTATDGTIAPGVQGLTEHSGHHGFFVIDTGDDLVDSYAGNSTASGRRVGVPLGASVLSWSSLTSDGLELLRRSIEWAHLGDLGVGMVGYWKLDETSGTTAEDSSGNGYEGVYTNGPVLGGAGVYGYSASFDGSNDHVAVNSASGLNLRENVTVSCWAKSNTATWNTWAVVSKRPAFLLATEQNTTEVKMSVFSSSGQHDTPRFDVATLGNIQQWRHYVAVYDYNNGAMRLYVDGVLRTSSSITAEVQLDSNPGDFNIGWDDVGSGSRYFDGQIDDVRLYNRVLGDAEVLKLYGLKAHYKLDETSGSVAADSSGHGADGAYVNGPGLGASGVRGSATTLNDADANDRIDLPSTLLDGASAAAVSWWMKTTRTGQTPVLSAASSSQANELLVHFNSDTQFTSSVNNVDASSTIDPIADGNWRHFVYQIDRVTGVGELYINGQLAISQPRTPTTDTITVEPSGLVIGQEQDSLGGGFSTSQILDGDIDDLRVYDRRLTAREIAKLYGLVGHWRLDETSGTAATDASGADNHGAMSGATDPGAFVPYPFAVGLTLDDPAGVRVPYDESFNMSDDDAFSIACWVQPAAGGPNSAFDIAGKTNESGRSAYLLRYELDQRLGVYLNEDNLTGGGGEWIGYSTVTIDKNQPYHLCVTYDAGFGELKIFINGQLDSTHTVTTTLGDEGNGFIIGDLSAIAGDIEGVADVTLYNRVMQPIEVAEHYGLVGYWTFDEGSGVDIADSSGLGNNAVFNVGAPQWIDGKVGDGALEFDGSSSAETERVFDPTSVGAVSMWWRSDGAPSGLHRPWGLGGDFEMWQGADGLVSMDLSASGQSGGFVTTSPLTGVAQWYHVVAQYDSATDNYEIYLDGVLHKSGTSTQNIQDQAANLLSFGTRTGSTQRFTGAIDDFRIYNRWLGSEEVGDLFGNANTPGVRIMRWVEVR